MLKRNYLKGPLLLVCGLLAYRWAGIGFTALMNHMYGVWGVNQANIHRAPGWIQLISGYWECWLILVQSLALLVVVRLYGLITRSGLPKGKAPWKGLAAGGAFALALAGILLLMDGLRMGWPLGSPRFSPGPIIALAMYFVWALSGEMLFRGALREALSWMHPRLAQGVGALLFALFFLPGLNLLTFVNLLLMGLVLEKATRRTGGYLWGVMARFSLYALLFGALGCAGGAAPALYECYPAKYDLLTGAFDGPLSGALCTLMLAAARAADVIYQKRRKRL